MNYAALPVSKPRCQVHTCHRDGQTRFDGNYGYAVNYRPTKTVGPVDDPQYKEPPLRISGDADLFDRRAGNDGYTQAGDLLPSGLIE